ncbi:ComEA family DNA-binding protein [Desulfogranum marinum]|uniref:ComEA family DNA-binding protein n=1 Tax=Desulfogranum marinum TaxID=453220 RepID=UPI001962DE01|nr:helix-hairpin-helix domain-containing protein [Desulfogranum marinum]MBM9511547.1 helix-hairpin-helix domain-containing protein [Desulfogranum marinum]
MTRQSDSEDGINTPYAHCKDKRVLVLAVLGGLLFITPWLNQQQIAPTQKNLYILEGQHLYVQRLAAGTELEPITDVQSLQRNAGHPTGSATATANQPVSPALLSRFFNFGFPLNKATMKELELLPGIGPSLAREIYTHRMQSGNFTSIHELQAIPGIGEKTLQRLKPLLDFGQ